MLGLETPLAWTAEGGRRIRLSSGTPEETGESQKQGARGDEQGRESTADGSLVDRIDAVEAALADAISRAAEAGEWTVVAELGRELAERRRARQAPAISSIDAARAKRDRGQS
jgi:hypothetical protein